MRRWSHACVVVNVIAHFLPLPCIFLPGNPPVWPIAFIFDLHVLTHVGSSIRKALILQSRLLLLFIPAAMATFEMQPSKGFANSAAPAPSSPVVDADDRVRVDASGMATGTEADAWDMARMGRSQELRRNFESLSVLGLATTTMSTWVALLVTNAFSLTNGGLAGTVWVYLATWICTFALAASLAEMASMAPTSGGQYRESLLVLTIQ
jgi:hypothetical protein